MMGEEEQHSLVSAKVSGPARLDIRWSNDQEATINLGKVLEGDAYLPLNQGAVFEAVQIGDWGQSLVWPGDIEIGADSLWLDCLSAWGREDTRAFLEWRLRNGFSAAAAAQALGITRPSVVKYSTGATVPRSIQLACRGWDALKAA